MEDAAAQRRAVLNQQLRASLVASLALCKSPDAFFCPAPEDDVQGPAPAPQQLRLATILARTCSCLYASPSQLLHDLQGLVAGMKLYHLGDPVHGRAPGLTANPHMAALAQELYSACYLDLQVNHLVPSQVLSPDLVQTHAHDSTRSPTSCPVAMTRTSHALSCPAPSSPDVQGVQGSSMGSDATLAVTLPTGRMGSLAPFSDLPTPHSHSISPSPCLQPHFLQHYPSQGGPGDPGDGGGGGGGEYSMAQPGASQTHTYNAAMPWFSAPCSTNFGNCHDAGAARGTHDCSGLDALVAACELANEDDRKHASMQAIALHDTCCGPAAHEEEGEAESPARHHADQSRAATFCYDRHCHSSLQPSQHPCPTPTTAAAPLQLTFQPTATAPQPWPQKAQLHAAHQQHHHHHHQQLSTLLPGNMHEYPGACDVSNSMGQAHLDGHTGIHASSPAAGFQQPRPHAPICTPLSHTTSQAGSGAARQPHMMSPTGPRMPASQKARRHKTKVFIRGNKVVYLPSSFVEDAFDPACLPLQCALVVQANGELLEGERHNVTIKAVPRQGLSTMYCMTNVLKIQHQYLNWQISDWTKLGPNSLKMHLQSPGVGAASVSAAGATPKAESQAGKTARHSGTMSTCCTDASAEVHIMPSQLSEGQTPAWLPCMDLQRSHIADPQAGVKRKAHSMSATAGGPTSSLGSVGPAKHASVVGQDGPPSLQHLQAAQRSWHHTGPVSQYQGPAMHQEVQLQPFAGMGVPMQGVHLPHTWAQQHPGPASDAAQHSSLVSQMLPPRFHCGPGSNMPPAGQLWHEPHTAYPMHPMHSTVPPQPHQHLASSHGGPPTCPPGVCPDSGSSCGGVQGPPAHAGPYVRPQHYPYHAPLHALQHQQASHLEPDVHAATAAVHSKVSQHQQGAGARALAGAACIKGAQGVIQYTLSSHTALSHGGLRVVPLGSMTPAEVAALQQMLAAP